MDDNHKICFDKMLACVYACVLVTIFPSHCQTVIHTTCPSNRSSMPFACSTSSNAKYVRFVEQINGECRCFSSDSHTDRTVTFYKIDEKEVYAKRETIITCYHVKSSRDQSCCCYHCRRVSCTIIRLPL